MSDEQTDGQKEYAEYLESDRWKEIRAAAIARSGGRCQLCGKEPDSFNVHHNRYPEIWGQEKPEDMVALCPKCHEKHHGKTDKQDDVETVQLRVYSYCRKIEDQYEWICKAASVGVDYADKPAKPFFECIRTMCMRMSVNVCTLKEMAKGKQ